MKLLFFSEFYKENCVSSFQDLRQCFLQDQWQFLFFGPQFEMYYKENVLFSFYITSFLIASGYATFPVFEILYSQIPESPLGARGCLVSSH